MVKVALHNTSGEVIDELELNEDIFDVEVREDILHKVVTAHLAKKRTGTASTKTRSEVRGGGRKPWRQKGTGRARHGTIRSPIWRGGGITFGPKPRAYNKAVPKKVKRLAMKCALSSKFQDDNMLVIDQISFDEPKTKEFVKVLGNLNIDSKALLITGESNENIKKSARNLQGVKNISIDNINVYDILYHDKLILTKDAIDKVEEVYK